MARQVNDIVLPATSDAATGLILGAALDSNQMINMSLQCVVSDATAAGTFGIQVSNDVAPLQISGPDFTPTNWTTLTSLNVTMAAGTLTSVIQLSNISYRWVRATFNVTTLGTGTVKVQRFGMGV